VSSEALRLPPHSAEAEQAVLGGLMLDNTAWDRIADELAEEDFYRRDHRLIYRGISELVERGAPADAVTVAEHLGQLGCLEEVGGLAYLGSLARDTPSAANIAAYSAIVRERAVLRRLIEIGGEIASSAYDPRGRSSAELVESAEQRVFQLAERRQRRAGIVTLKSILPGTIDRIDMLYNSEGEITGVPTGFEKLDKMTAGLQPGELIIIAGRPSMGKTSLAVNIAEYAAIRHEVKTAIFSMEMSAEAIAMRLISSVGRVNHSQLRTGSFADEDWNRINHAVSQMTRAPIFVDETPALTPGELRTRSRRLKREHGLGLIVVDYLQLMQVPGTKENRATEISEISRSMKALAKELKVPIVALSQLNRSVEQRQEKRPVMSDLRESGALEQDADLIAFIYREEVYDKDTPRRGIADIIVAKQRNGPTGDFPLTFLGEYTRFENYVPESYGDETF
jgi:replicative DNA helicase